MPLDLQRVIKALEDTADAIEIKIRSGLSWSQTEGHAGQHQGDVDADLVAVDILTRSGFRVFSEESGYTCPSPTNQNIGGDIIVVIDPVDGSTNASRGIPFYSVSLCAVNQGIPVAALVRNLASGDTYRAQLGGGSSKNGRKIFPSSITELSGAVIGINGYATKHLGWAQYRALGSAALELCLVAEGSLDGYIDLSQSTLASWDVLGGYFICLEAGASILACDGSDFAVEDLSVRNPLVAGGTYSLADKLRRNAWF